MKTVGIDGCRTGWVAVMLFDDKYEIEVYKRLDELLKRHADADCILIDMPVGLPETVEESERRPEREARRMLRKRSSTVFNVPCRQALLEREYKYANAVNREILGKGLSKQSFYIGEKIREADQFLESNPNFKNRIMESHPELLFAALSNEGAPLQLSKKTDEGAKARLNILGNHDRNVSEIAKRITIEKKLAKIRDDIIDAYILAVAGKIGVISGFRTIPERPAFDKRQILMQMVMPSI